MAPASLARPHLTRLAVVAALFRSRPGQPISGRELAQVGGYGGWRTRVSDCRLQLGMNIPPPVELRYEWGKETFYTYLPPEPVQARLFEEDACSPGC